jgi:hypothetical protein
LLPFTPSTSSPPYPAGAADGSCTNSIPAPHVPRPLRPLCRARRAGRAGASATVQVQVYQPQRHRVWNRSRAESGCETARREEGAGSPRRHITHLLDGQLEEERAGLRPDLKRVFEPLGLRESARCGVTRVDGCQISSSNQDIGPGTRDPAFTAPNSGLGIQRSQLDNRHSDCGTHHSQ